MSTRCPVCGNSELERIMPYVYRDREEDALFAGRHLLECKRCSLFFAWPLPEENELQKYYESMYRNDGRNGLKPAQKFPFDNLWYLSRGACIARLSTTYIDTSNNKQIQHLDVGAGYGHTSYVLKRYWGHNLISTVIEPDTRCHLWLNQIADRVISTTLQKIPSTDRQKYDICTLLHALEHFRDPAAILKKIRQTLSDSGILLIEVPNCSKGRVLAYDRELPHVPHLFFWNRSALCNTLELSGFQVLHADSYGPQLNSEFRYDTSFSKGIQPDAQWESPPRPGTMPKIPFPVFETSTPNGMFLRAIARKADL